MPPTIINIGNLESRDKLKENYNLDEESKTGKYKDKCSLPPLNSKRELDLSKNEQERMWNYDD
jgi:hypothetical protein